jgi:hypothetical protein
MKIIYSYDKKLKYGTFSPHQTYALSVHSGLVLKRSAKVTPHKREEN